MPTSNKQLIIGIDIDGTLLDILTPWVAAYNLLHNASLDKDSITDYYWPNTYKCNELRVPDMYTIAEPVPGSVYAVNKLKQHHKLIVISHDRSAFASAKISAIEKHFGITDIVFARKKRLVVKIDLLIDDSPYNEPDIMIAQNYNNTYPFIRMHWHTVPDYVGIWQSLNRR